MDLKSLKKEIENLSELNGKELVVTLKEILIELLNKIEKLESYEPVMARFFENYFCANLDGLLIKEGISVEEKKTRFMCREKDLEIDCIAAGKKNGTPILIVAEVKSSVRDEDINKLFKKLKQKKNTILANLEYIIEKLDFPEEYKNTDKILLILATNKINESLKIAGERNDILVIEFSDMPSGGVVYWASTGW